MLRRFVFLTIVLLMVPGPAAALTEADCAADRAQFVRSLAETRVESLRRVEQAREAAGDDLDADAAAQLDHEAGRAYEHEEHLVGLGDQIWRDCVSAVRARAPDPAVGDR